MAQSKQGFILHLSPLLYFTWGAPLNILLSMKSRQPHANRRLSMHLPSNPYHIFEVYQSTEVYFRGKQLRPAQNCHAYRKQTGRHSSKDGVHMPMPKVNHPSTLSFIPALSPVCIAHTNVPLPTSPLFSEATQSADSLDESELPRWEEEPPYMGTEPDSTPQEEKFTHNLFDVMLGWCTRLAKEAMAQQRRYLESGNHVMILTELASTIMERLVRWSDVMRGSGIVCWEIERIRWRCAGCRLSGRLETSMTSHMRCWNWNKAGIHTKTFPHSYMSGTGMLRMRDWR